MTGLIYKELKINRFPLIMLLLFFIITPTLVFGGSHYSKDNSFPDPVAAILFGLFFCIISYMILGVFESGFIESGDKKVWAYFIKSTPQTEKGEIAARYMIVFALTLGLFLLLTLVNLILSVIWIEIPLFTLPVIYVAAIQLMILSIQFPITLRFGHKTGLYLRVGAILLALIIFGILVLYSKAFSIEKLTEKLMLFYEDILGETGNTVPKSFIILQKILNTLCIAAPVLYFISYRISCRMYLKGVEANHTK